MRDTRTLGTCRRSLDCQPQRVGILKRLLVRLLANRAWLWLVKLWYGHGLIIKPRQLHNAQQRLHGAHPRHIIYATIPWTLSRFFLHVNCVSVVIKSRGKCAGKSVVLGLPYSRSSTRNVSL
jgi:hypothetical protein